LEIQKDLTTAENLKIWSLTDRESLGNLGHFGKRKASEFAQNDLFFVVAHISEQSPLLAS
jgi:hypothetical protein